MVTDRDWPGGGEYRGREEFKRFMQQFMEAFATIRFEQVTEPEIVGSTPVFRGHWTGAGMTSGIEASSVDFSVVFWSRDGLITEIRFFFHDAEAREYARSRT